MQNASLCMFMQITTPVAIIDTLIYNIAMYTPDTFVQLYRTTILYNLT